ncbi:hypothetical protein WR25_03252 [Diploscapter pachys]|uniref:TraB domain-containing protein n=1 Tax=Diploscapter pachys TaxID=2018661 RepID=A0A2A2JQ26_9BILA|nr:hypothetical protein WR25_03252 [Diploscapter pachys]
MGEDYPHLSRIFVEERDAYMTYVLHNLLINNTIEKRLAWGKTNGSVEYQPLRVVAVVGIGHTPGIVSRWNEQQDISQLIRIPERSFASKAVGLTFRAAFWGGIGYLLYRGGARVARRFIH